jgi:prophage regulatory protein
MRLIRLKSVIDSTGMARSTIYKYIDEGLFPKPVSLGARSVAWVESEVQDWILCRIKVRDDINRADSKYKFELCSNSLSNNPIQMYS